MQIFGHFYQFVWADLWTLGQNRGQDLLLIVSGWVENIGMPTSKPEKKEPKKPLSVTHPELAKQAVGWDPSTVTKGSHKNLSWECSENHKWNATVKDRTQGRGCPLCFLASPRKFRPLAIENPTLAKQAFGWNPMDFGVASNKKMTWKCELEHTWDATIRSRSGSRGCPYCSNNKIWPGFNDIATTHPEISKTIYKDNPETISAGSEKKVRWICSIGHIFEMEVKKRIGRNYGCPYCSNSKLLIGFNDFETKHPEFAKEADGWDPKTVIGGSAVFRNWKCNKGHSYSAKVSSRDARDSGCPYCANQAVLPGFNDLATTHPELAIQADGWDPTKFISSKKNLNWKCKKGHKTKASIQTRKSGSDCRVCVNQEVLFGFNDLQTKFPKIAAEAVGWDPKKVFPKSSKRMMWQCKEGHKWKATVGSRTGLHAGCPTCSPGGGFDPNDKGFLYFLSHPHWMMHQIGITNVPDRRLHEHKKLGWEVLEIRGPMSGHLTQQWESAILRMLKAKGADLSNEKIAGKFDGYSEAWTKATFSVDSIKELMRLTDEYEEGLGKGRSV